jgi:hypothetical protein
MEIRAAFDALSSVVDGYDSRGLSVETVDATADGAGGVRATAEVGVPPSALVAGDVVTTTDDGALRVDLPTDDLLSPPPSRSDVVSVAVEAARTTPDGLVVAVAIVVDPPADDDPDAAEPRRSATDGGTGPDAATETTRALAEVRDESVPPFEDVAYLRRLYERCDTFTEMTRLFERDVSAETVRRYTIEAGVHDPDSYDTDEDESDRDDLPDDVDVPADLTVDDVSEAVADCRTVHEVGRRLGLGRARTRDLLRRLDLVDLVTHRIDAVTDRGASPEEVAARIRSRTPGDA